jgi:YidC/Oxa1 family membrane protein insertase
VSIWDQIFLNPVVNVLIVLSKYLFNNFGLTIIVLTIVVNIVLYPLTLKQLKASKAMQDMQAKVAEIKKKYGNDRQKAAEEQMKLMKESGMSYVGCLLPMLIQFPVWIILYQSILKSMAATPEDFLNLSQRLYTTWPVVFTQVPLAHGFLWLNLSTPDMIMALLTGASMWVQQKMMTPPSMDPQQRAQNEMMQWMMPLMFAFLGMSFPSGLSLYWVTSTVIRCVMQYFATGWGGLTLPAFLNRGATGGKGKEIKGRVVRQQQKQPLTPKDTSADIVVKPEPAKGDKTQNGKSGEKRQDRGRGGPKGS